jgi:UPF0271 protein
VDAPAELTIETWSERPDMARTINLNADLGEGIGDEGFVRDAALLSHVASASIACGFHAGDPAMMRRVAAAAAGRGVGVGAHPSYADKDGFGRREMTLAAAEIETAVAYQIGAMQAVAALAGTPVTHVKPHGALYNQAARDPVVALAIGRAIRAVDPALVYVGLAGSEMVRAAEQLGLAAAREAFPDRGYAADGSLLPRTAAGAVVSEPADAARRACRMACDGEIVAQSGTAIRLRVDTLCIHGDAPHAVAIARAIREALASAGVAVVPLTAMRLAR